MGRAALERRKPAHRREQRPQARRAGHARETRRRDAHDRISEPIHLDHATERRLGPTVPLAPVGVAQDDRTITASRPILAVEKEPATLWRETEDREVPRAHRLAEDALGSIVGRDVESV